jgi:hypothetical protein
LIGQKRSERRKERIKSPLSPSSSSTSMSYVYDQQSVNINNKAQVQSSSSSTTSMNLTPNCKVTVPKSPRPQRTLVIFENVITGLSLSLASLKAKVSDLTTAVTNGYTAMTKVTKLV